MIQISLPSVFRLNNNILQKNKQNILFQVHGDVIEIKLTPKSNRAIKSLPAVLKDASRSLYSE